MLYAGNVLSLVYEKSISHMKILTYFFASIIFVISLPLIIIYSMHMIGLLVARRLTDGIRQ